MSGEGRGWSEVQLSRRPMQGEIENALTDSKDCDPTKTHCQRGVASECLKIHREVPGDLSMVPVR